MSQKITDKMENQTSCKLAKFCTKLSLTTNYKLNSDKSQESLNELHFSKLFFLQLFRAAGYWH